jgi:hypothetical protein
MNTPPRSRALAISLCAPALFFLASSLHTFAQPGGGPGASPADRAERLMKSFTERLALSDSQTVSIRAIVTASMEQGAKEREQYAGDREAMMQASKERNDKMYAEIEKLLTKPQIEKFTELRNEMRQRAQRPRPSGGEQR